MSEVEMKEAEVVVDAPRVIADDMLALVKEQDKPVFHAMSAMTTLDWKNLLPNQTALLLMQKPFTISGGGVMYLNFKQALLFAVRCYELELSPFSDSVWFDTSKNSVNLTLAGKRELARIKGIDLGPPKFDKIEREWKDVKPSDSVEDAKKAGFVRDLGYTCHIRVGDPKYNEQADYTAWISEWYVGRSPVWKAKPEHMLQTRACEKCISLAMGTGASSMWGVSRRANNAGY